jgi:hypothetical protein
VNFVSIAMFLRNNLFFLGGGGRLLKEIAKKIRQLNLKPYLSVIRLGK